MLFGLLLSYALIDDFRDLFRRRPTSNVVDDHLQTREIAQGLIGGVFRSVILGLWIATLVKLQVAYLLSDGENILTWLANDFGATLGFGEQSWDWLSQHSMGNFTTFVLAFVHCFIFIFGVITIRAVLQASVERHQAASSSPEVATLRSLNKQHLLMIIIVLLLAANVLLTGQLC